MKKKILTMISFILLAGNSYAGGDVERDNDPYDDYVAKDYKNYYAGFGYQINNINGTNRVLGVSQNYLSQTYNNVNIFAGYKINDNAALELGFFRKNDRIHNTSPIAVWFDDGNYMAVRSSSTLQVISLDGIFSAPIDRDERFKILGIAGLSDIYFKTRTNLTDADSARTLVGANSGSANRLGINIGTGVETRVAENVALRATAKFTRVLNMPFFDNFMSYNVALKFDF